MKKRHTSYYKYIKYLCAELDGIKEEIEEIKKRIGVLEKWVKHENPDNV